MNQPDKMTYVPDWAYKTAEVKFLKIFKLCFYSEWRDNGECLASSKSVDEFRLKLQILGYDF